MNVSPDALRKETVQVLNQIDNQIDEIEALAEERGIEPEQLRDNHGGWVMPPLLLAKVQGIAVLVHLNEQGKRR